jgi:MFS family permease
VLQLNKLAVLDAAGRQYARESYASKSSFLVPFAVFKSVTNLLVGALADTYGRRTIAIIGWCVGLMCPTLVLSASTHGEGGWTAVVTSAAFLGVQQGMVWSCMIYAALDLCGARARGFASGLNETVGYTSIAIFAQVYGAMERAYVECAWVDEIGDRASECVAVGAGAGAGASEGTGTCDRPDDWTPACLGSCVCEGYTEQPFELQLGLMLLGLVVTASVLKETLGMFFGGGDDGGDDAKEASAFARVDDESEEEDEGDGMTRANAEAEEDETDLPRETMVEAFVRASFKDESLRALCLASFCANFETGMAWGLISSWARDGLLIGGRERDFFTGCYSFLKGLSQFGAGLLSDKIGRRAPIVVGLFGGAVAMLTAAFGAGFRGRLLVGSDADGADLVTLQFGYLVLAGVLLGLFTGLMYPVQTAAAADHAPAKHSSPVIGVVRFWRDLGYAMSLPIAAVADASSPEAALIVVAIMMGAVSVWFGHVYEEKTPDVVGAGRRRRRRSAGGLRGGGAGNEDDGKVVEMEALSPAEKTLTRGMEDDGGERV